MNILNIPLALVVGLATLSCEQHEQQGRAEEATGALGDSVEKSEPSQFLEKVAAVFENPKDSSSRQADAVRKALGSPDKTISQDDQDLWFYFISEGVSVTVTIEDETATSWHMGFSS